MAPPQSSLLISCKPLFCVLIILNLIVAICFLVRIVVWWVVAVTLVANKPSRLVTKIALT